MTLSSFYILVLCISIGGLITQLFVREKQLPHILFAVFCDSIAMTLTQKLSGDAIGAYKYLIGLGTVATCNCYWLLSRSFFRQEKAIERHHLAFALVISLLIFIKQGYLFASSTALINASEQSLFRHALSEITILLSSCVLVLSFWEGCRGFKSATKKEQLQRVWFLSTFALAVGISKLSNYIFAGDVAAKQWVITAIILMVVVNTHILLIWRNKIHWQQHAGTENTVKDFVAATEPRVLPSDNDVLLAAQISQLIENESLFLQANLKVADVARHLDVPEYRVSRALKTHISDKNFNQYINGLRIEHAKELLADTTKQDWSVLVVSLESGFASVGPFSRAFKSKTGVTPNQFRQMHVSEALVNAS